MLSDSYSGSAFTRTSGFPSLEDVRGNGSLLGNDVVYGTHDVEFRHFYNLTFNCTGRVTKFTFIALPVDGRFDMNVQINRGSTNVQQSKLRIPDMSPTFGLFGYSYEVPSASVTNFQPGDTFQIRHDKSFLSHHRLLYKSGVSQQYVCWWWTIYTYPARCEWVDDYPLMAIETGSYIATL